ncbi:receptor-type tyrosine-protein phosphatase N2-like [Styela clava]
MASVLFIVLTLLSVAATRDNAFLHKRYGCKLAPNIICTPPEHCLDDGFAGNCEVSHNSIWKDLTVADQLRLLEAIRDLELQGYDYKDVENALKFSSPTNRAISKDSTFSLEDYLTALQILRQDESLKFGQPNGNNREIKYNLEPENNYRQEYRRSQPQSLSGDAEIRKMKEKELIEEARQILRKSGMTFDDLTSQEMKGLVKILAKHLIKNSEHNDNNKNNSVEDDEKVPKNENVEHQQRIQKSDIVSKFEPVAFPVEPSDSGINSAVIASDKETAKTDTEIADSDPAPIHEASTNQRLKNKNKTLYIVIIVVGATVLLIIIVTILSCAIHAYRTKGKGHRKFVGATDNDELGDDYQELCRQHYATKNSERTENAKEVMNDLSGVQEPLTTRSYPLTKPNEGETKPSMPVHSIGHGEATRNSSVSSSSWSEEPVTASLDISTGHAVLSYMEDHLNNKDRLDKEWEDICGYEADSTTTTIAITPQNSRKNRSLVALPYDNNRIKLNSKNNHLQSDYINASSIIDNDPRRPLYIAGQGPLASTIPDFWQMMWENGCVAIVMLTPLVEEGVNQCARYWPDEGSCTYHNFEIHLVSEHIWCEDYLVRSLYLKHLPSGETRTVTQFHFLSWPNDRVPSTAKPLLELRRKVTKCYKGHNAPVLVHCSDGVGRTGTYILLDLVIDRMLKGAKEIDIAATLEHIRDQRVGMVHTKEQFEFALTAVAEEVNAILKALLR